MSAQDSQKEKIDRNWQELLQELRVAQTGVQILTGFLLTLPFTPRFHELADSRHAVYAAVLCASVVATFLLMTPVALHRALFGHDARPWLVEAADRASRWGLAVLALANIGAVWLVIEVVATTWIASVVAGLIALFVFVVWIVVPARELKLGD
ncbi:DUF6328 family protein [Aeromicrobium sp. NPDC092404]|uniref:DUF6328 family protein n=1 Tax=Aeromicrobium sp. NPDC092404 TaxID=3154976 RepID=UPI00342CFBDA